MSRDASALGAMRVRRVLRIWEQGRTPADGPPDREEERILWYEPDGRRIDDPVRIAECERARGDAR